MMQQITFRSLFHPSVSMLRVKRAMDLYLLRKENIDEDSEHIFIKSNLKK
jgi:hypothetical protein